MGPRRVSHGRGPSRRPDPRRRIIVHERLVELLEPARHGRGRRGGTQPRLSEARREFSRTRSCRDLIGVPVPHAPLQVLRRGSPAHRAPIEPAGAARSMRRRVQVGSGHGRRRHRRPKNAPRGAPAREESAAAQRRRGRAEARRARRSVVWVARAPLPHLPRGGSHLGPTSAEPHEGHERPEAPGLLGAPLIANSDAAALHGRPVVRRPASVGARGRHVLGVHLLLLRPEHPSGLVHRPRQRELGHGAGRVPSSVADSGGAHCERVLSRRRGVHAWTSVTPRSSLRTRGRACSFRRRRSSAGARRLSARTLAHGLSVLWFYAEILWGRNTQMERCIRRQISDAIDSRLETTSHNERARASGLGRGTRPASTPTESAENQSAQRRHGLGRSSRNPASDSHGRRGSGVHLFGRASRGLQSWWNFQYG